MLENYLLVLKWNLARLHYLMSSKGGCVGFPYMLHFPAMLRLSNCIYATKIYNKMYAVTP